MLFNTSKVLYSNVYDMIWQESLTWTDKLAHVTKQNIYKTRKLCYHKDDRTMRAIWVDREPLRRYGHSKLSTMAAAAILNLFESKIAPLDPPSPKTPP